MKALNLRVIWKCGIERYLKDLSLRGLQRFQEFFIRIPKGFLLILKKNRCKMRRLKEYSGISIDVVYAYQYYCTAANSDYFKILLNLIGSIHETNFDKLGGIAVFDLGLTEDEIKTAQCDRKSFCA